MAVRVITDSSAGLPADICDELDITVLNLHVMESEAKDGQTETSTSGLSALELAAAFGRQMERAHDDGIVALHLSRELSSTWSAAVTASGVFPDTVRVIDSGTAGMVLGAAAMAAARLAQDGASLDDCYDAAQNTLDRGRTWVYVHSTEELRKSGRISTATMVLSTALLATKPILAIQHGKLELVGKTRTQTKAFTKLTELIQERAQGEPCFVAIQHNEAEAAAETLRGLLEQMLPADSTFMVMPLGDVMAVHTGPGALGVSVVFSAEQEPDPKPAHKTTFGWKPPQK